VAPWLSLSSKSGALSPTWIAISSCIPSVGLFG
jgi:hypothetical protein